MLRNFKIWLWTFWLLCAFCAGASAYIGPGAGFAFLGSFLALFVTILLAFGTIMIWPIRAAFRKARPRAWLPPIPWW